MSFEWRYVAAGLGWGVAVGMGTGILLGWTLLATAAPSDLITAPSLESVAGFLLGMLHVGFYGALIGLIPGSMAGVVIGCVLSVLVGRQPNARRAVRRTSVVTLLLVPSLGFAGLWLMGWYEEDFRDPWLWLALGYPTLLGVPAMSWTARRLARRNHALSGVKSPDLTRPVE